MDPVDWAPLAEDLRRTTGRELVLLFETCEPGPPEHASWFTFLIFVDGEQLGGRGQTFPMDPIDPQQRLAVVADLACEDVLNEAIWGGWPTCPVHHTHPLEAKVDAHLGVASWTCPKGKYSVAIGSLREIG
jgi:hypothetical protein